MWFWPERASGSPKLRLTLPLGSEGVYMVFETNLDPELASGLEGYRAMGFTGGAFDLENLPAVRGRIEALLRAQIEQLARSQAAATETVSTEDRCVPGPADAPKRAGSYLPPDRAGGKRAWPLLNARPV